ncbi:DDE-type integrase/transposase/recombinase [Tenacibaculum maritimum]|uniref:DDE-type integrase/transposase/recombinase n=1 Tax=Tenacibaculum maritimum TaxID=107401 RepID=UPI0038772594
MGQIYHANAKTNITTRSIISKSTLKASELSLMYGVSKSTIYKWRKRDTFKDKSCVPNTINYSLSAIEENVLIQIRRSTWSSLDEILESFFPENPRYYRSIVYRSFKRHGVNKVPVFEKQKAKKFKEYKPGFLHIDVTYLPSIEGKRYYLFVAIDRSTRLIYYKIYKNKTASNAANFLGLCTDFHPFKITKVLTDNGAEFTNRYIKKNIKKGRFDKICSLKDIEHRLTAPFKPQTNGMVEKANDIIKQNTVKIHTYANLSEMDIDLTNFLKTYNLYRRHGSLRKELNVRSPFDAVKKWYSLEPFIFHHLPTKLERNLQSIASVFGSDIRQQSCET